MKKLLVLITALFIVGCGNGTRSPRYKIIFLTDFYKAYLDSLKVNPGNLDTIYGRTVFKPIFQNNFVKSEYAHLAKEYLFGSTQDTLGLAEATSSLDKNREKIKAKVLAALKKCDSYLKKDSLTIYIFPAYGESGILNIMKGMYGFTAGSHQIALSVCPEIKGWEEMFDYTVAHEFQHAQWTQTHFASSSHFTLLDCMLFEGKADSFAHALYPQVKPAWLYSLSENDRLELWTRLKSKLNTEDLVLQNEIMYGSPDYPDWGGYIIGYYMLQSALEKNAGLSPKEWTGLKSDQILKMSQFSYENSAFEKSSLKKRNPFQTL